MYNAASPIGVPDGTTGGAGGDTPHTPLLLAPSAAGMNSGFGAAASASIVKISSSVVDSVGCTPHYFHTAGTSKVSSAASSPPASASSTASASAVRTKTQSAALRPAKLLAFAAVGSVLMAVTLLFPSNVSSASPALDERGFSGAQSSVGEGGSSDAASGALQQPTEMHVVNDAHAAGAAHFPHDPADGGADGDDAPRIQMPTTSPSLLMALNPQRPHAPLSREELSKNAAAFREIQKHPMMARHPSPQQQRGGNNERNDAAKLQNDERNSAAPKQRPPHAAGGKRRSRRGASASQPVSPDDADVLVGSRRSSAPQLAPHLARGALGEKHEAFRRLLDDKIGRRKRREEERDGRSDKIFPRKTPHYVIDFGAPVWRGVGQ